MFGSTIFAGDTFAGEQALLAPPVPVIPSRPALVVPCNRKSCPTIPDLTLYNLQDALYFNGVPLSILQPCPEGYVCTPGTFPHLFTYPEGTFMTTIPLLNTGFPVVITIQGCESELSVILPPNPSPASAQAAADNLIQRAAEQQARCDAIPLTVGRQPVRVIFSALPNYFCLEDVFNQTVVASTTPPSPPYTYTIGAKPAWMNALVTPTGVILSGTPPASGAYSVTIGATSATGTGAHTYTFNFVEINDASPLPAATKDSPYSFFLDGSDIPGILAWGISAGALPTGLSLDAATGEISGTPTVEETANFTVSVTNGDLACSKDFELAVGVASPCATLLASAVWTLNGDLDFNGGSSSASAAGNLFSGSETTPVLTIGGGPVIFESTSAGKGYGTVLSYTGPEINCCFKLTFNGTAPGTSVNGLGNWSTGFTVQIVQGFTVLLNESHLGTGGPVNYSFPFTIPECLVPTNINFDVSFSGTGDVNTFAPFFPVATSDGTAASFTFGMVESC